MDHQLLKAGLEEARPDDTLMATLVQWQDTPSKKKGFDLNPCSYAIAILINRRTRFVLWGTGYSTWAIPQQVFAIQSLLSALPEGRRLQLHAHHELTRYIELDGIGRYAMGHHGRSKSGKPLDCYLAIADIINAYDSRLWSFIPYRYMEEAPGYFEAEAIVRGKAKTAALKHKADHAPTTADHPKPIILEEHVYVFPE